MKLVVGGKDCKAKCGVGNAECGIGEAEMLAWLAALRARVLGNYGEVTQCSPGDGQPLICSFSCVISLQCYLRSGICRWAGCSTRFATLTFVPQPAQRRTMFLDTFQSEPGDPPHLNTARSFPFCFPCSGKVMRPVPPRKGHRRCARARPTIGRCVASP